MPEIKELNIRMADQPGMLGKLCKSLGQRKVNILGFQSVSSEGKSVVRMAVDNVSAAKAVLDGEHMTYTEGSVAQVSLPNRPGELGRAASQLGDAKINIDYAYCGIEPQTNKCLMFFGVKDVSRAAEILDRAAAAAAKG